VDLSIIIVSWNVRPLLERCLRSISQSMGGAPAGDAPRYEVIVVDNGSADGSPDMLRATFPWARLLANSDNRGFAAANNQGLHIAQGRYLMLLNPDTEVVGGGLPAMLQYMDEHPDIGLLGPQLVYPDGAIQPSRRRFPTYATGFIESTAAQRWWPAHPLLRRYYMQDMPDDQVQDVDWLVGACLLLRRQAYEQVGDFDERYFMYSEELDYAYRLRRAGWRAVYLPAARVVHHEGRSSEQVIASRLIMFHTSKVQLYAKLFGPRRACLLRAYLLATFVFQWAEEALKWLLGHKRSLRRERMAAYSQALRSGLRPAGVVPPSLARM